MNFPQYRKYKNNQSYFQILSRDGFIEYKRNGKKVEVYKLNATILPDRNFIADMLDDYHNHWDKISEAEFQQFLSEQGVVD